MNYAGLLRRLTSAGLGDWAAELEQRQLSWFNDDHHGDLPRWAAALESLPEISALQTSYSAAAITLAGNCEQPQTLETALKGLAPWRKGPYHICNVYIDSEWRSDLKWERVFPHLADLRGRRILDVGCGNGYHCWRMLASNPELVLGIDPSVLFNLQFQAVQHYANDQRIYLLPMTCQQLPNNLQWFDTVFSMGVLYHRRSPFDHLLKLKSLLRTGGELCLETLIIPGAAGQVLVPGDRYARMNNVWFLPTAEELLHWLRRCGFANPKIVDVNRTTTSEQRSTAWMTFESLAQCLDPNDDRLTVEGYPAPTRAVALAQKT